MRKASMMFGVAGGIMGLILGLSALIMGGLARVFGADQVAAKNLFEAVFIIIISILGLLGGSLARSSPTTSGTLMIIGGIAGFRAGWYWIVPGIAMIIGSALAFLGRGQGQKERS